MIVYNPVRIVQDAYAETRGRRVVLRAEPHSRVLAAEPETKWSLAVPAAFDWTEAGQRGIASALLSHGERQFPLTLFHPDGIAQVAGWDSGQDDRRYERNAIVVRKLTKESAERAVEVLGHAGFFRWLLS